MKTMELRTVGKRSEQIGRSVFRSVFSGAFLIFFAEISSAREPFVRNCAERGAAVAPGCQINRGDHDQRCPRGSVIWRCPQRISCRVRFPQASTNGTYCSREPALESSAPANAPRIHPAPPVETANAGGSQPNAPAQPPQATNSVARNFYRLEMPAGNRARFPKINHLICARPAFVLNAGRGIEVPGAFTLQCPNAAVLNLSYCDGGHPGTLFACNTASPLSDATRTEFLQNAAAYRRMNGRQGDPVIPISTARQ